MATVHLWTRQVPIGAERCAVTHMMAPVTRYKRDRVALQIHYVE
jgi:hypothetical protein